MRVTPAPKDYAMTSDSISDVFAAPDVRLVVAPIESNRGGERTQAVARYGQAFKDCTVARLLPPESSDVYTVAEAVDVSAATLERTASAVTA